MNNNEKGMDFGKPKLTRQDVMRILRISSTTLWRWERDKKIIPQFTLGRQARYDYDYIMNFKLPS